MGIPVNPPLQERIPKLIADDPEARRWFEYLLDIIEKLRLRSGGGTDNVSITLEDLNKLKQKDAGIEADIGKNRAVNARQDRELSKLLQLIAELISDNSKLRAELNDTNRLAKNMNQLLAELQ